VTLDPSGFTAPTALVLRTSLPLTLPATCTFPTTTVGGTVLVDPVATGTIFGQPVSADTPAVLTPSGGSLTSSLSGAGALPLTRRATST